MRKKNYYKPYGGRRKSLLFRAVAILLLLGVGVFAALQIYIRYHAQTELNVEPEVLVVFGCKVETWGPSTTLQDRLETALDYLEEYPDAVAVVTGGKGDDEIMPEGQAMWEYLTANGVEESRILVEDQARSTSQNVENTLKLLEEAGYDSDTVIVTLSSDFHLARIEMLWERATGEAPDGKIAAPVSHKPSAVQMFFREPLALVKSYFFD